MSQSILAKTEDAMAMYIDSAWSIDQAVPGTRSSTASAQLMLVQRMSTEAALVSLGRSDKSSRLLATISRFESNHRTLIEGNAAVGKRRIPPTTEPTHLAAMRDVWTSWQAFENVVRGVAESGYASTSTLEVVANRGAALRTQ